jgi:hypothetical protein
MARHALTREGKGPDAMRAALLRHLRPPTVPAGGGGGGGVGGDDGGGGVGGGCDGGGGVGVGGGTGVAAAACAECALLSTCAADMGLAQPACPECLLPTARHTLVEKVTCHACACTLHRKCAGLRRGTATDLGRSTRRFTCAECEDVRRRLGTP